MEKYHRVFIAHFSTFIASAFCLGYFIAHDGSALHKLVSGFFIGTYAMFGKEIARLAITCVSRRHLPRFDTSRFANITVAIGLILLAFVGLFAWFVSWEGSTGVFYGLGVLATALISDWGLAPLFAEFNPPIAHLPKS